MARITHIDREPLTVEIDGQEYFGTLTTTGAQEVKMTVEYKGQELSDGRKWGTDAEEQHNMRVIAKTLLLQMVQQDRLKSNPRRAVQPNLDVHFAYQKFGTALSIMASHPERIQERLSVAYREAMSVVPRKNIPSNLLGQYDSLMQRLEWIESGVAAPSDDEAQLLATAVEDLYAHLEDEAQVG
jgi:hypothetical protein